MVNKKRVFVSTLFGGVLGNVGWSLAMMGGPFPWARIAHQIFIYALMGFVIGISNWKVKWWLHGVLIGLLFGISNGFGALWMTQTPATFVSVIITGLILGLVVELITSFGFKARMPQSK